MYATVALIPPTVTVGLLPVAGESPLGATAPLTSVPAAFIELHRFLGGSLERYVPPNLPSWAPREATEVTVSQPSNTVVFDWAANERLNNRIGQTYIGMSMQTTMDTQAKGISNPVPLLPAAFTTAEEAHAGVSLSEVLSYEIGTDRDKPAQR
jgi:hypothetical protein